MTTESVSALIKKWRDEADRTGAPTKSGAVLVTNEDRGYSNALYSAADELAALLTTRQEVAPVAIPEGWALVPTDPVTALPMLHALADAAGMERLPDPNDEGSYPITGQQSTVRQWFDAMMAARPASTGQTSDARDGRGRFFASGPEGHFYADTSETANAIIRQCRYDRDDWTVTDLYAAMQEAGK